MLAAAPLRHGRTIAVVLLVNLALLGLGEMLTRFFHVPDRMHGFPRRMIVATDDPDLPYYLRPDYETVARGMEMRTNHYGMRGPDVPLRPAPGVRRILALGGSTTFGEAVAEEESWPARLEEILEERTGQPHEVLNAGVEGYNTRAELAFLQQRGLPLSPDVVVVGFSLDDGNRSPAMGPMGILTREPDQRVPTSAWTERSTLYLSARLLPSFGWAFLTRDLSAGKRKNLSRDSPIERGLSARRKAFFRDRPEPGWSAMLGALEGFAQEGREHGVRVLIAILPYADQVHAPTPDLTPQRRLMEKCSEYGLECLDLRDALESAQPPLFLDGVHPNPLGYRVIAEALADYLAPLESRAPGVG